MSQKIFQYIIENQKIIPRKIDIPLIKNNEVLIKVWAAGVNRADLLQVEGKYRAPENYENLPGLEISGEIVAIGTEVHSFKVSDKVCGLIAGGGYAEYVLLDQELLLPIPPILSYIEAAALPESIYTFYLNFFCPSPIFKAYDKLLITGGASGISSIAILLAKAYSMEVCALVSNNNKKEFCFKVGADLVINYQEADFINNLKLSNFFPDLILDMYGGEFIEKYLHIIKDNGKILLIGTMNNNISSFSVGRLLMKNVSIIGKTLRSKPTRIKKQMTKEILHKIWPLIKKNKVKPYIDRIFTFAQIEEAHDFMRSNKHLGKIILSNIPN